MLTISYFMQEALEYVHRAPQKIVPIGGRFGLTGYCLAQRN